MKQNIIILYVLLIYSDFLEGKNHQNEDGDYRLPGKTILSNIIRSQNNPTYLQKLQGESLSENILTQFLNRFQPALDRETKRVAEKLPKTNIAKVKADTYIPYNLQHRDYRNLPNNIGSRQYAEYTRLPRKVSGKSEKDTLIKNTKDRDVNNNELEEIVEQIHKKVIQSDKMFDMPLNKVDTGIRSDSECVGLPRTISKRNNEPLMLIECSPVETHKIKNSNKEDIKYSCNWHPQKNRRYVNNSAVTIMSAAVAKTCSTPLFVRKFTDICTTRSGWCPETTITPCKTTPAPVCQPWCNPFLKGAYNAKEKLRRMSIID